MEQNFNRSLLRYSDSGALYALRLADAFVVAIAGIAAHSLRFSGQFLFNESSYGYALLATVLLTIVVFSEFGVYRGWSSGQGAPAYYRLLFGWILTLAILAALSFVTKTGPTFSRLWFAYTAVIGLVLLVGVRVAAVNIVHALKLRGIAVRKVVLIGPSRACAAVRQRLADAAIVGFRIVAEFHADEGSSESILNMPGRGNDAPGQVIRPRLDELDSYLEGNSPLDVWMTWPLRDEARTRSTMDQLRNFVVNIRWVPDIASFRLLNHGFSEVAGLPLIDLSYSPMTGLNAWVKGLEDKVLGTLIVAAISPLLLILAIAVKLTSTGPVFYRQERIGWNGKSFRMLKFRSMPIDVERGGVQWGTAATKPLTPIGGFLRRTSLDELPQFINVLKGDMSIVGPRPERPMFVEQFKDKIPGYMKKHMVKAGITGWAQVNGFRGDTDLAMRIEHDLYYIEHWSLWFDLRIILRTVLTFLFDRNAY